MADRPKSFWVVRHVEADPSQQWVTHYTDNPILESEAELIHILHRGGIPLAEADSHALWENASALGLHRVETYAEKAERDIVAKAQETWEATKTERMEHLAGYQKRRKERDLARRKRKVT